MNPYAIRFVSRDVATAPVTAILDFPSKDSRDAYWTAFWRNERGYQPLLWTGERFDYTPHQVRALNAKRS